MNTVDAIIVTGANGLLGASIIARLCDEAHEVTELIAIVRSEKAMRELRSALCGKTQRTEILIGDLCQSESLFALVPPERFQTAVVIHCAADVAWDKSEAELAPINVGGTRSAAQFAIHAATDPALIYVSSAYTRAHGWEYRNGYEASKATAERLLRAEFPKLPLSVFSCSLVIGNNDDGRIARFHGLYPLMRLVSAPATPFVIGREDCMIDIVPIDWVTDQLLETTRRMINRQALDVVASSGEGAVRLKTMFRVFESEINRFRSENGFTERAELPILSYRQWDFLKRSIEVWKPEELSARELRHIMHLIEIYRPYTMSDEVRPPLNVTAPAPAAESILPASVRYWLESHSEQLLGRWRRAVESGSSPC